MIPKLEQQLIAGDAEIVVCVLLDTEPSETTGINGTILPGWTWSYLGHALTPLLKIATTHRGEMI